MAQILPDVDADSTDPTCLWFCVVGVRVSAPVRRGAAPYGDGSLRSQRRSHLISLPILGDPVGIKADSYKEFCVRQFGTLEAR